MDTNVLVYAHRREMEQHPAGLRALTDVAEGGDAWALPVFVVNEFVRVVTHPRIFPRPSSRSQAIAAIDALLESPSVRVLHPGERYWRLLQQSLDEGQAHGNLVHDAAIVALCREHGVATLLTADRDFLRFPSIAVQAL